MELTLREFWTVIHGMGLGAIYLLAFTGGLAGLWSVKTPLLTEAGIQERIKRLRIGLWVMAITAWATVISGTFIVYPWYRAKIPTSPRSILLADPAISGWHTFGMEWKEHIAWLCPILTTVVAFLVTYYGKEFLNHPIFRKISITLFCLAFVFAGIAGFLGAFITKIAPIH